MEQVPELGAALAWMQTCIFYTIETLFIEFNTLKKLFELPAVQVLNVVVFPSCVNANSKERVFCVAIPI